MLRLLPRDPFGVKLNTGLFAKDHNNKVYIQDFVVYTALFCTYDRMCLSQKLCEICFILPVDEQIKKRVFTYLRSLRGQG